MGALLSFERAAFHLSFTKAADELGVTPSAISHRIAALEAALHRKLFVREVRSLKLTQEGASLAAGVTEIRDALLRLTAKTTSTDALRVSLGPYFSSSWLMPRLEHFEALHPNIRVELVHATGDPDLRNVDVAIFWSDVDQSPDDSEPLFQMTCTPVARPDLCPKDKFLAGGSPPLHYKDRTAWRDWLDAAGHNTQFADQGDVFEDPHLLFEAAAHGRGIALGLFPFISSLFLTGRLVPVSDHAFPSRHSYLLKVVDPSKAAANLFAEWLRNTVLVASGTDEKVPLGDG
ncbi:MAG: LysR substrate-binding domain-containing protein [Pseudomonadota bacterium]